MAKFLNTTQLNEWISKLIAETKRELVIIVPYIKISQGVYDELVKANQRGVETTLVYRENKLLGSERAKFQSMDNLNLMHHPNIHCKCYYNESYVIICSMNMYEYSEKNNREMGILLHREDLKSEPITSDDTNIFKDVLKEINEIINGAQIEKASKETSTLGFEMDILKTDKEKQDEFGKKLSKIFLHKKFEAEKVNGKWICQCKNYFDKMHVSLNGRIELNLNMPEDLSKQIYSQIPKQLEFQISGFKLYWNSPTQPLLLYGDKRHADWKNVKTEDDDFILTKRGIDQLIIWLRRYI